MSNSISYGLCARACIYLSLYIDGDCSAAHVYIFTRGAISEKFGGFSWSLVDDRDDHKDGGGVHFGNSDHPTKPTRYESVFIDPNY